MALAEYGAVRDPITMLHVYPIGHCGTLGPAAAAMMEGMGIGPARELFVRYAGEPALNNIRICAHCQDEHPRPVAPLVVTHAWSENGARKSKQMQLGSAGEYGIETGTDPVNESIEMAVPSGLR